MKRMKCERPAERDQSKRCAPHQRGFMFDVDGTLLLSDRSLGGYELLPGAVETLTSLKERSIPVRRCSPTAAPIRRPSRPHGCAAVGLPVADDQMFTPSSVAAGSHGPQRRAARAVLGTRGVGHALREAGIETVYTGEPRASEVDAVYVGWHPDCGMKDIEAACKRSGPARSCTSPRTCRSSRPSRAGRWAIRSRSSAPSAADEGADDPHRQALAARDAFRGAETRSAGRAVGVVGDDPLVEIIMARRAGATAFGVTTGDDLGGCMEAAAARPAPASRGGEILPRYSGPSPRDNFPR